MSNNLLTIILACKDGIARAFRRLQANGPYVARPEEVLATNILPDEVLKIGYYVPGHVASGVEVARAAVEETTISGTKVIYPAEAFVTAASQAAPADTTPTVTPRMKAECDYARALAADDSAGCSKATEAIVKLRRAAAKGEKWARCLKCPL